MKQMSQTLGYVILVHWDISNRSKNVNNKVAQLVAMEFQHIGIESKTYVCIVLYHLQRICVCNPIGFNKIVLQLTNDKVSNFFFYFLLKYQSSMI